MAPIFSYQYSNSGPLPSLSLPLQHTRSLFLSTHTLPLSPSPSLLYIYSDRRCARRRTSYIQDGGRREEHFCVNVCVTYGIHPSGINLGLEGIN